MKRLIAPLLCLLLLWTQALALAQPAPAETPAKCTCCSCQDGRCCVGESTPAGSQPLPLAPASAAQFNLQPIVLSASLAWLLPTCEARMLPATAPSPWAAARVPLFTRDCALLI